MHRSKWPILLAPVAALAVGGFAKPWLALPGGLGVLAVTVGWARQTRTAGRLIPERSATGHASSVLGVWLLILGEVFLFGGLFFAHFTLEGATPWPLPDGPVPSLAQATAMTGVLLASGVTGHFAVERLQRGQTVVSRNLVVATILLGGLFLGLQVVEYSSLLAEGLRLSTAPTAATFYALTGTHGLHVLAGVVALGVVSWFAWGYEEHDRSLVALRSVVIYWHFVDAVWIALYLVLYLDVL